MAAIKWASSFSGDWLDAGAWGGVVPGAADTVLIAVPNITVTVSSGVQAAQSLTTSLSAFSVKGGTLTVSSTALFGGAFSESGGAVACGGAFIAQQGFTVTGGNMYLNGNQFLLNGAALQSGGFIQMGNGQMQSQGSFTEAGGTLALYYQGGVFNALNLSAGLIQSYAPNVQVNGAYTQTGGTLSTLGRGITLAGSFSESGTAAVINVQSGELLATGSGTLAGTVSGAGTLHVQSGTTTLGAGIVISLPEVSVTGGKLALSTDLTLSSLFSMAGSTGSQLALGGHTMTVSGRSSLGGEIMGAGTYTAAGGGQINQLAIDGSAVVDLTSAMNVTGGFAIGSVAGSRGTLNIISSKARLNIAGDYIISDASLNGQINNSGFLVKSGGSGTAIIYANTASIGAVSVSTGTLSFNGAVNSFAGVVGGTGTFELAAGQTSFAKGIQLNVARVLLGTQGSAEQLRVSNSLTYTGEFDQAGGTLWLDGGATTLTATGRLNLNGGMVTGSGVLSASAGGRVNLSNVQLEGTTTYNIGGIVNQTGNVSAGDMPGGAVTINIASGALWNMRANSALGGVAGVPSLENATINNAGTLQKLNGSTNSNIAATLNNTGTLSAGNSTLSLYGGGTLGGVLAGGGTIDLDGTYTLASGVQLGVGRLGIGSLAAVTLASSAAMTGGLSQDGGTLSVGNATLTVAGLTSLEIGTLASQFGGTGGLVTTGALTIGDNYAVSYATLTVAGSADQIGDITVADFIPGVGSPGGGVVPGSAATLVIKAGAAYVVDDNASIVGNGTLSVAGTMSFVGNGISGIGPSVIDSGLILGNSANLAFQGPVSGGGTLLVGDGGSMAFSGAVAATDLVGFSGSGPGGLYISDPTHFGASIAGFASGDFIELTGVSNNLSVDRLTVAGNVVTVSDTSFNSVSLTFTTAQTAGALSLAFGPHGGLALFHS